MGVDEMKHREITEYFYNDFIDTNLRNLNNHPQFNIEWMTPEEIINKLNIQGEEHHMFDGDMDYTDIPGDLFLYNSFNDAKKLGLDVHKNGMYNPILLQKVDDVYSRSEGSHRLRGILHLYKSGVWDKNKKICFLVCEFGYEKMRLEIVDIRKNIKKTLDDPDMYKMDDVLTLNAPLYHGWDSRTKLLVKYERKKLTNEELQIYSFDIENFYDFFFINGIYYGGISNDLFLYHNTDEMIHPSPVVNDEKFFKKYMGDVKDE